MKPSRTSEVRRAGYRAKNAIKYEMDTSELDAMLAEMESDISDALRPAVQAGAQYLYNEVKQNVASIGKITGNLDRSIYQAYATRESIEGKKVVYDVSWNPAKAPHGHLVEYGHIQTYQTILTEAGKWITLKNKPLKGGPRQVGARPFISPAVGKLDQALNIVEDELMKRIKK